MLGGGRTYKANTIKRKVPSIGFGASVTIRSNTGFEAGADLVGATERAATQTWQLLEFSCFEWRCETAAHADPIISTTHSHAIDFENNRILAIRERVVSMYTETRNEANGGRLSFATSEIHQSSNTLVTTLRLRAWPY